MKQASHAAWRYNLVLMLILLAVAGLGVRQSWLLREDAGRAVRRAERQQRMVLPLPARPGSIFARTARRYVPLAASRQVPSCYADGLLIPDSKLDEVAIAVADALDMDPRDVQDKLLARRENRFIWLKREITDAQADAVRALRLRALGITHEWRREYPSGDLAATVIGFRRTDGVAGAGLELTQDAFLAAEGGQRVVLADARRRAIWPLLAESRAPRDGRHVMLCLDAVIQEYLQNALAEAVAKHDAKWGAGVVVDPATGEVLAMCSVPTYDPNQYNVADAEQQTNRTITTPYEPGSVFKPIIAAAAVELGLVSYETNVFCENGTYQAPRGGRISDHGHSYGSISLEDGVVYSSNICMAKVGEMLGNETIHAVVRSFGFGEETGVELPGESAGIVRPIAKWDGYSLRRVPFGQEISASTMQLAMAFSALANGGLLLRPRLIDQVTDDEGRVLLRGGRQVVRRVLSPAVAARSLAVMEQVVQRGTGKACRMKKWTSFGKTGTAQIAGPGGYVDEAFTSSFVGGAPTSDPRLICVISVYWPRTGGHYGSTVAAPYVRQVLEQSLTYLGVPPDRTSDAVPLATSGYMAD